MPVSYGFRPRRRAHDAIAEIHQFGTHGYRWVLDADIEACFDSIDHTALMDRVRARVKDKRVLALVKAFLKAGVLTELGEHQGHPHRHAARRHPVPAVWPTSPCRCSMSTCTGRGSRAGRWPPPTAAQSTPRQGPADLADRPLRRRLRRARARHRDDVEALREDVAARARAAGSAAVTGQDPDRAHERGVRLPRLPHPVETQDEARTSGTSTPSSPTGPSGR